MLASLAIWRGCYCCCCHMQTKPKCEILRIGGSCKSRYYNVKGLIFIGCTAPDVVAAHFVRSFASLLISFPGTYATLLLSFEDQNDKGWRSCRGPRNCEQKIKGNKKPVFNTFSLREENCSNLTLHSIVYLRTIDLLRTLGPLH